MNFKYYFKKIGDQSPQNHGETIFCIFFVFLACMIFGYSLNSIGIFLNNIYSRDDQFNREIGIINNFLKKKNVGLELSTRIHEYLEYVWHTESNIHIEEEENVINKLSSKLKEELKQEAFGKHINKIHFLKNFSFDFLKKLTHIIKEENFSPDDLVLKEGKFNFNIYIIKNGQINLTVKMNNNEKIIDKLGEGQIFNELNFLTKEKSKFNAQSLNYSSLFKINYEDFLKILNEFPDDYEIFCGIRDKIALYGDFSTINMKCRSCKEPHQLLNCNLLHYFPFKELIIFKNNYNIFQERKFIERKKNKKKKIISKICNIPLIKESCSIVSENSDDFSFSYISSAIIDSPLFVKKRRGGTIKSKKIISNELDYPEAKSKLLLESGNMINEKGDDLFKLCWENIANFSQRTKTKRKSKSKLFASLRLADLKAGNKLQLNVKERNKPFIENPYDNFFKNFESVKNFKNYYIKNNFENVVNEMENIKIKKRKLIKKYYIIFNFIFKILIKEKNAKKKINSKKKKKKKEHININK